MTAELGHGIARDIYALLYSLCCSNGGSIRISQSYIIQRLQCTEFQCKYNIRQLEEKGYVERKNNYVNGRGGLTEYVCKKGVEIEPPFFTKKGLKLSPLSSQKRGRNDYKKGVEIEPPYKYIINNNKSALFNSAGARDLFCDFIKLFPHSKLREKKAYEQWGELTLEEQQAAYNYAKEHPANNICFFLDDKKWQTANKSEILTFKQFYERFGTTDPAEIGGGWSIERKNNGTIYKKIL